tara:strand:+ start:470 stop:616 length:147 start_codon:yes stop_codon:yes gene_type:complete
MKNIPNKIRKDGSVWKFVGTNPKNENHWTCVKPIENVRIKLSGAIGGF